METFLNNKKSALVMILILAFGTLSGVATAQFVMASQIGKLCVFFACGNANITGGTTSSGGGGGGGGQPTPTTGTIIVTKAVKGCDIAACPPPESFTIKITGTNPSPSTVNDDGSGTKVTIDPGEFAVAEAPTAGFIISFSGDCDGKISAGDTKNCTVINTKTQPGTLTVIKEVDNSACPTGGTQCKVASDFQIKVTATNVSPSTPFPGSTTGKQVTLDAGSYTVEEVPPIPPGYLVTFKGQCTQPAANVPSATGTMTSGGTQTCTVVNTFKPF